MMVSNCGREVQHTSLKGNQFRVAKIDISAENDVDVRSDLEGTLFYLYAVIQCLLTFRSNKLWWKMMLSRTEAELSYQRFEVLLDV